MFSLAGWDWECGQSVCREIAEAGGARVEDFEGPGRSLGLALGQWEALKNFTNERDSDRGPDCEDGAGPAGSSGGRG